VTRFTRTPPSFLDRARFLELFGGVYEHSPWVAEGLFKAGIEPDHDRVDGLAEALAAMVEGAGEDRQLTLLRAHPDLAGKLAQAGDLTAESASEQAGAGLDQCTAEEFAELQTLNDRYKEKFGFPFILAVRGRSRAGILQAFRARVENSMADERREALDQVHRIARLRLHQIAGKDCP